MITKTDKEFISSYLTDASNFKGDCDIVYIPESTSELISAVKECSDKNLPMTIAGAGTGLTGGRVPLEGAVISTERLNRIISIDETKLTATVEPGVMYSELDSELSRRNLFLPPNPTEKNSSLGGNAATNASGSRTFKYGATRKWIDSMKVILADGSELVLSRTGKSLTNNNIELVTSDGKTYNISFNPLKMPEVKNAAGILLSDDIYPIDIFIGSEGALGIISEITFRLLKSPGNVLGLLIFFDDAHRSLDFISEIRNVSRINNQSDYRSVNGISARLIEYFDKNSLSLFRNDYSQVPENAASAVWIEQEYTAAYEDSIIEKWSAKINEFSSLGDSTWLAMDAAGHERIRQFRHALPSKVNEIIVRNNMRKIGTDVAVPENHFVELYDFIVDYLETSWLDYLIWGHFGDCHIHANVLPRGIDELNSSLAFYDAVIEKTLEFNGTVSAEHGIGKIKRKYLYQMFGESGINEMKKIKDCLDPRNLLGRGNLFI